jgi:hypothetical protein
VRRSVGRPFHDGGDFEFGIVQSVRYPYIHV